LFSERKEKQRQRYIGCEYKKNIKGNELVAHYSQGVNRKQKRLEVKI
jgi:hypothetical protein